MTGEWIEPGSVIELRTADVVLRVTESPTGGMRVMGRPVEDGRRLRTRSIENSETGLGPDSLSIGLEAPE